MKNHIRWQWAVAFALGLVNFSISAAADLNTRYAFSIPSQPLSAALLSFSEQANIQVMTASADLSNLTSTGISGERTAKEALDVLLKNTGLKFYAVSDDAVAIEPIKARNSSSNRVSFLQTSGNIHLAQSETETTAPNDKEGLSKEILKTSSGIPEIMVKGKRGRFGSLNADIQRTRDDVLPYVVIDRKEIERAGAANVDDLLRKRLSMNYVQQPNDRSANTQLLIGNSSNIALRGLDSSETLVLVDGRRITRFRTQTAERQSDLNAIPLASIERIEVLSTSASGIYGANATAGVINVILRRDYVGMETDVSYGNSFEHGGIDRSASIYGATAFRDGRVSVSVAAAYSHRGALLLKDRDVISDRIRYVDAAKKANNPLIYYNAASPPLGETPNISSARVGSTAPNLVLKSGQSLGSPITHVPDGYLGVQSDGGAALVANAGSYNLSLANTDQSNGRESSIAGEPTTSALTLTFRNQLTPSLDSFFELSAAENDLEFASLGLTTTFRVPASASANPFQQDIIVSAPLVSKGSRVRTNTDTRGVLAGLKKTFSNRWSIALDNSFTTVTSKQTYPPSIFLNTLTPALASGSVNLVQSPARYTETLRSFASFENILAPTRSRSNTAAMRVAGLLGSLPTGDVAISVVAEDERQHYSEMKVTLANVQGTTTSATFSDSSAISDGLYAEVRAPIASDAHRFLGMKSGEVQVAGRYGRYNLRSIYSLTAPVQGAQSEKQFSSIDPSIGLRLEPIHDLALRTSYGTGLRPPALGQLQAFVPATRTFPAGRLSDPKRGGESLLSLVTPQGGNPDLKPEESTGWSAGLIFNPTILPEFRMSIDWTKIRKQNNITSVALVQETISNEDQLPGIILRAPTQAGDPYAFGRITGLDLRPFNATRAESESYDVALDYELSTERWGRWTFSASGTRLMHSLVQVSPLTLASERVGSFAGAPKWAGNATLLWNWRDLTVGWTSRFLDSYALLPVNATFDPIQGSDQVSAEVYHDASLEYRFEQAQGGGMSLLADTVVWLGVRNVLNTQPRFYVFGGYYTDTWSDLTTPSYYVSFKKSFGH